MIYDMKNERLVRHIAVCCLFVKAVIFFAHIIICSQIGVVVLLKKLTPLFCN